MPIRNPDIFVAFSDHFEMEGEHPFMIRTYRNASRTLYGMVAGANKILVGGGEELTELPA